MKDDSNTPVNLSIDEADENRSKLAAIDKVQAIIEFLSDGTILNANENFLNTMGYHLEDIQGKHHSIFVEDSYKSSREYREFWDKINRGENVSGEFKRVHNNGENIWLMASYNPVFNKDKKLIKVIKLATDVTNEKIKNADYQGQLDAIGKSQAIIEFNLDGTIITANQNFLDTVGYELKEIQGRHHRMFVETEYAASNEYRELWDKLNRGEYIADEFKRFGKHSKEVWIQASYNPIFDLSGKPFKVVKYATDITEQKIQNADYIGQLNAISKSQGIIEFNMDGTIITANDNFLQVLGYRLNEVQGKHHRIFLESEYAVSQEYKEFWKDLNRGEFKSGEFKRLGKGGRTVWIQASYNPIFDLNNNPYKVVKYASDVTEQKELIMKSQRDMKAAMADLDVQNTRKTRLSELYDAVRGELSTEELGSNILTKLAELVDVHIGAFYMLEGNKLDLVSSYAYKQRKNLSSQFSVGEGLIGQCAKEKKLILISSVPDDYIKVVSGLGETTPKMIMLIPIQFESQLLGVIEIGTTGEFKEEHIEFLEDASENIGVSINSSVARVQLKTLLEETQAQQEELKGSNEELEEKTEELKRSEENLKAQAEELRSSNEELEEKTKYLEAQRIDIENKNREVETAKEVLEQRAEDLEMASKYKSEFLANMSHELRTPLNSLLILSKELSENEDGNLTGHQVESAKIIHGGGNDLLTLINDILDLSKVEAGKLDVHKEDVDLNKVLANLERQFNPVSANKGLSFISDIKGGVPSTIVSDSVRTEQIIKNLLSNAFKFTTKGSVRLIIDRAPRDVDFVQSHLNSDNTIAISVTDTGIGIPHEKQREIFEAFQQADGSTSRKYGGTGLGLTISRQLAKLLGGELQLTSEENKGSTFTLYLPTSSNLPAYQIPAVEQDVIKKKDLPCEINKPVAAKSKSEALLDDLIPSRKGEKSILIIEDDENFAKILENVSKKKGYKCHLAHDGKTALQIVTKHAVSAVMLDLNLPDISGDSILDELKNNSNTRHIPIHIVSASENNNSLLEKGAIGYLRKPASSDDIDQMFARLEPLLETDVKNVLVIEDDRNSQIAIRTLIKNGNISLTSAMNGKEAISALRNCKFDCIILDFNLPDISGFELLEKLNKEPSLILPPVIIYTGRDLSRDEHEALSKYASSIVIKGVHASERLLDETLLFLHTLESNLPSEQRSQTKMLKEPGETLANRKVLLVDDDLRNTFALSTVLNKHGLKVVMADNGKKGIEALESDGDVELVIMDVMMPIMDGLEAMREIRKKDNYKNLPIISLTAKAMLEDKTACLEAGANDYLTKPVDVEKLLSLIEVWLAKEGGCSSPKPLN